VWVLSCELCESRFNVVDRGKAKNAVVEFPNKGMLRLAEMRGARTSTGLTSTPNDGATAWTAPNCPIQDAMAGSRRTAARVTRGAISLSNSSHFPLMPYS
jgi:hypothetical protein